MAFRLSLAVALALVGSAAPAQVVGPAQNVLFPSNANLIPQDQELIVAADGSWIAGRDAGGSADVVVAEMDRVGMPGVARVLSFPSGNDIAPANPELVASPRGRFFCCYGTSSTGDLVFIGRDVAGTWFTQNVSFPSGNDVPLVGTRPVISPDEAFIVCRGDGADLVVIPIDETMGFPQPGNAYTVSFPSSNNIPLQAVTPVVTPNGRTVAVPGTSTSGDIAVVSIGRPVTSANTTAVNVAFPSSNGVAQMTQPLGVSPRSNYFFAHGSNTNNDLVVIPLDAMGAPLPAVNVSWPSGNNTASTQVPATVSRDGRLIAVNGSLSTGDLVLLPMDAAGMPGTPRNVAFPGNNFWPNAQLPPRIDPRSRFVVQRGSATLGDLVVIRVTFTTATTVTTVSQNVLFPGNNNVPDLNSHVALAPDGSFCVTHGIATTGDLVLTALDAIGMAQPSQNVAYPTNNNVSDVAATPIISPDGMRILTGGSQPASDAVLTCLELDPATGFVRTKSITNVAYAGGNANLPVTRQPRFAPTGQYFFSAGSPTVGDVITAALLAPVPHVLAPTDMGTVVPVRFFSPTDANANFQAAAALGRFPGIGLADGRNVPVNFDGLFMLSTFPGNAFFVGFAGTFDAMGVAQGQVFIPRIPGAEGACFYLAFIVNDPMNATGVGTISQPSVYRLQ